MKRNMKDWLHSQISAPRKKALPILSFPSTSLTGRTVREFLSDSNLQAEGMLAIARRCDSAASVSPMDLSVEAECFGSKVIFADEEIPTIDGHIISSLEEARRLAVPTMGSGRSGICIDAMRKAASGITDRPILAGMIGPFSLAGRLMDVTEIMIACYEEPEAVHAVIEKAVSFLIEYARSFKEAGANGVVIAEPMAGLLSPEFGEEFSSRYVRQIVEAVQDDSFLVIYHNCGGSAVHMLPSIIGTGASGLHFGNVVDLTDILPQVPGHIAVLGNIDPVACLKDGTPAGIRETVLSLMKQCTDFPNFILSSGCDIPPLTPWENIDAFFQAVDEFYQH